MLAKIYLFTWLVFLVIFLLAFLTGSISLVAWNVFGLFAFGLVFMGMIGVLPVTSAHPNPENAPSAKPVKTKTETSFEVARSTQSVRV